MKTYTLEPVTPLIHLYDNFAMCCDGVTTVRVNLTDEQVIRLASAACDQAAKILRREKDHVRGKAEPDADSGRVVEGEPPR